jgi:hypothetical protein
MAAPVLIDGFLNPLQPRFDIDRIGGQSANRETCALVQILMAVLDHEDLVAASDLLHQAANRGALGLETARLGDVQLEVRDADVGFFTQ